MGDNQHLAQLEPHLMVRALRSNDLDEVVNLHIEIFPDYFLTALGKEILRLYYMQFMDITDKNIVAVAVRSGEIVGCVVGSSDHARYKKFYRRHFLDIGLAVLLRFATNPVVRNGLIARIHHVREAFAALAADTDAKADMLCAGLKSRPSQFTGLFCLFNSL